MTKHWEGMSFFEALDECELYNGNPEPFRRCRELYRRRCDDREDAMRALERLAQAAQCRESTQGDPLRLIEVQAELRAATQAARDTIEKVKR